MQKSEYAQLYYTDLSKLEYTLISGNYGKGVPGGGVQGPISLAELFFVIPFSAILFLIISGHKLINNWG